MGPLSGKTIIEFAGLGPGPYAGMMLADMGAEVIRVERPGGQWLTAGRNPKYDVHNRGKSSICINMKSAEGIVCAKKLIKSADALIEGYRPGVMEKLGLGPDECLDINPKLVYGRMTGWGQDGPLTLAAGHDINYISIGGALGAMGYADRPPAPPLNLVGDFGGGAMYLLAGVLAALVERGMSGKGQVIDAAIASSETPQGQVELWKNFREALNQAKGKPGCPTDGLYVTTVRNKIFDRLAGLPTPENSKEVEQVLGFLKAEKCNRDDLLKRYRGALIDEREGAPK